MIYAPIHSLRVSVTNKDPHTLSVNSGQTNSDVNTILAGRGPYAVTYNPVDNLYTRPMRDQMMYQL